MSDLWYRRAQNAGRSGPISRRRVLGGATAMSAGLASLALAGCGSDEDDADATATSAPSGGTRQPSPATSAASPTTKALPEEFIFAGEREPADMLPFFAGFDQATIMRAMNETMVHVKMTDPQKNGQAVVSYEGVLAQAWEHPDPTTWVFKLRPNVKFHDGTAWDAQTAKVNLDIYRDTPAIQALGKTALMGRYVKNIEAIDATTLKIETISPLVEQEFFGFAFYLGFAASSSKALAGGINAVKDTPVGTGPYRFDQWRKGEDLTLVRNEEYWGEKPNMKKLKFIWRPEASVRAQTIKAGEAHLAFNIGSEQASGLENSIVGGGFQSNMLRLNNTKAPTNDIRVRRAINFALDRDAINKAIFKGSATPIGFFAYQPVKVPVWKYDPAQAKSLLSAAGANGAEVEFIYGENRVPEEPQLAEIYKAQLEAVGLKVKLTKVERVKYGEISAAAFDQQPEILMETTSSGNYGEVAGSLLDKYGCSGSGTFCSPEWDARFTALQSLGGAQRLSEIEQIAVRLQEDETPRAWVLAINQVHGLAKNVKTDLPLNVTIHVADLGFA